MNSDERGLHDCLAAAQLMEVRWDMHGLCLAFFNVYASLDKNIIINVLEYLNEQSVVAAMVRVGARELNDLCPDLTLTVAALERTLFAYIEGGVTHARSIFRDKIEYS